MYQFHIKKSINPTKPPSHSDTMNIQEYYPTVICVLWVEEQEDNKPPFYIIMNIYHKLVHSCILNSGACHNLSAHVNHVGDGPRN